MKNKFGFFAALLVLLALVLGCGLGGLTGSDEGESGQSSESSSSEGEKKTPVEPSGEVVEIGIPECDEVATFINDNTEEIEGSYLLRGIVYVYKNYVLENLREGVKNMSEEEKEKAARVCTKTLEDLKKNME